MVSSHWHDELRVPALHESRDDRGLCGHAVADNGPPYIIKQQHGSVVIDGHTVYTSQVSQYAAVHRGVVISFEYRPSATHCVVFMGVVCTLLHLTSCKPFCRTGEEGSDSPSTHHQNCAQLRAAHAALLCTHYSRCTRRFPCLRSPCHDDAYRHSFRRCGCTQDWCFVCAFCVQYVALRGCRWMLSWLMCSSCPPPWPCAVQQLAPWMRRSASLDWATWARTWQGTWSPLGIR
mgnify:CR=1 FL=1